MNKILQSIEKLKNRLTTKAEKIDLEVTSKAKRVGLDKICPNCKKEMVPKNKDIMSYNLKDLSHEYLVCKKCGFERIG